MQQTLSCPVCGNSVVPGQTFCGVCGTKLALMAAPQQQLLCPACGSPMKQGQQFCGTCGTNLSSEGLQQQWNMQQKPGATQVASGVVSSVSIQPDIVKETAVPIKKAYVEKKHVMLSLSVIFLQIIGWVVVIGGCVTSVLFAASGIGDTEFAKIPLMGNIGALSIVLKLVIGITISLGYGFSLLAFAEFCKLSLDIEKNTRRDESQE